MAMAPASGDECSITVVDQPTAHADNASGGENQQRESCSGEEQTSRSKRGGDAAMMRRKLDWLNMIVFCVAFLEWAGNTVGTVAFIWATVVLLGGFCSLLSRMDFWFSAIMIFVEGSRVFIRNDASVNQWLFGSTTAFRWENLSSPGALDLHAAKAWAVMIGVGISFTPIEPRPEIVAGILKVALLVTFSQLQTGGIFAKFVLLLVVNAVSWGGIVGAFKLGVRYVKRSKGNHIVSSLKIVGMSFGWYVGICFGHVLLTRLLTSRILSVRNPVPQLCIKVIVASGLACLPFLQTILPSYYRYISIPIAIVLLNLSFTEDVEFNHPYYYRRRGITLKLFRFHMAPLSPTSKQTVSSIRGLLLHILETILPTLFIWSLMYPLPGISLELSFYMLFSVLAGVLIANLQIPAAFLQVLLSIMRLRSLLGHHHHDYRPLPQDASPNLVPSIVVFFVMDLCQGSSYILATILGLISIFCRIWLVRDLKFEKEWAAKAINLYHRQAYQARTVKGLLSSEKFTPSLPSFAIECLGSTSSETQNVGLRILDTFLKQWDPESKRELIAEITSTSKKAVPTLIDMLVSTAPGDTDIRMFAASIIIELTDTVKISFFPGMVKLISSLIDAKKQDVINSGSQSISHPGMVKLPPIDTDSLEISDFPSVKKMISSLLDANNQQESQSNGVPENNGGGVIDSRSQSICTLDEANLLHLRLFPLLGMSILQRLASDHDSCREMVEEATYVTTRTIGLISNLTHEENSGDPHQKEVLASSLNFVRWLANNRGKLGTRFRQELLENPILLNSLEHILDHQPELWKPVMGVIENLAFDEAASQEIGSTQSIIPKLLDAFLVPDGVNPNWNNDRSLQMTAGKALANLTIKSTDNCWAILLAEQGHNLLKRLNDMLDDDDFMCVAAHLLHNLCANSRDKLMDVDLGASMQLESALPKVMQIIMTNKEGKRLEAALCVTSQIGYVIPKCFRKVFISETDAAALVEKLVDTLNSNREPCPEYPRIRRVLVEAVISIVRLCPVPYRTILREKKAKDALDMVKGTPSRLEKYRVFINGKGVLPESLPMRSLVDKAKRLINRPTPTPIMSAEQGDHA